MKKLSRYHIKRVEERLDACFDLASRKNVEEGVEWYKQAHEFCKQVATRFNTDTLTVAQVLSALSPRNKWEKNKLDTVTVFESVRDNVSPLDTKVSTFHSNKFKAFELAKKNTFIGEESQKTFAFCQNIAHLNSNYVTVDVWHLRACFGKTCSSVGKVAYKQIQKITIDKAKEHGFKGYEFQAIIWNTIQANF